MLEKRSELREDFEFARNWLKQLDHHRYIDIAPSHSVWRSSKPYDLLSRRNDEESKELLKLFIDGKETARSLGRIIEEYHDVSKFSTLKDFTDYLEENFHFYKDSLEGLLKGLLEKRGDIYECPTEEEAAKLFTDNPEDKYIMCRNNIITEAEYLLDTINNVLNWAEHIKKSGLLLRNISTYDLRILNADKNPSELKQQSGKAGSRKQKKTPPKPLEGEWSNPMTKSTMMSKVNIDGYKKFNTFAKQHGLRKAGNRQLWQIRLDRMDKNTRQKFEKN